MYKNQIFYQRIIEAAKMKGKSINCIERELGYSRNAIHNYRYGSEPSGIRLVELAHYFQMPPEFLLGYEIEHNSINLKDYFSQLSKDQKIEISKLAQQWFYSQIVV